jgi:hypothetical protein
MSPQPEVHSVNFVRGQIGEAIDFVPAQRTAWVDTIVQIDKQLTELGPGLWLPITLESVNQSMSLQHQLNLRGIYNNQRRKNVVYVQRKDTNEPLPARKHGGGRPRKAK